MSHDQLDNRFGLTAVESGFITPSQLYEAMAIQMHENLNGMGHRLIGQILLDLEYISFGQIRVVLRQMGLPMELCLCNYEVEKLADTG